MNPIRPQKSSSFTTDNRIIEITPNVFGKPPASLKNFHSASERSAHAETTCVAPCPR